MTASPPISRSTREKERYARQIILPKWGIETQKKLKCASVLVVGAGGLGGPVLQYLCAAGVGKIGITDEKRVSRNDLHSQVLFSEDDIGQYKSMAVRRKLGAQNPHIEFDTHIKRLSNGNALEIIREYDLVVDGSNNIETHYLISDSCAVLGKPSVYGSAINYEGQIGVMNFKGSDTFRRLYPKAPESADFPSTNGNVGALPGIIGSMMASEALKILTGLGKPLCDKVLILDLLNMRFSSRKFRKDEPNIPSKNLRSDASKSKNEKKSVHTKTAEEFLSILEDEQWLVIDIREPHEFEMYNQGGINIPLHNLPEMMDKLPKNKQLLFVCDLGLASELAGKYVSEKTHRTTYHLLGGLEALNSMLD
ncbi:MAG: HesA/MoeB/ThiF family protein [Cytophagales bacterium]|nr:HesA/MoeB/ThiF family protein [Cytophagales bacterium]